MPTDTPYGVTTLVYKSGNYIVPPWIISAVTNQGLSWFRMQVPWNAVQTSATPTFKWSYTDKIIQACNTAGVNVMYDILTAPKYCKNVIAPDGNHVIDPTSALTYVNAILARYYPGSPNGHIQGVSLNEDFDSFQPANTSANSGIYAGNVLKVIYPAIKAVDSTIVVWSAAHLQTGKTHVTNWHQQLYDSGAGAYWDVSQVHYYNGWDSDPSDPNRNPNVCDFPQMIAEVHAVDVANGYSSRTIGIGEVGWAATGSNPPKPKTISYALQQQWLMYCLDTARTSGYCSHFFYYTIAGGDANSLAQQGHVYRPAYTAIKSYITVFPTWSGSPPPPVPIFSVSPGALSPASIGVTQTGATYSATVTLSETSSSIGNAHWAASTGLSGVIFSPVSGTLSPGGSVTISISNIPATSGSFTFVGAENETPVSVTWDNSAYAATILADGPQAYYRLDETSGLIAHDLSGNGYDAPLTGVTAYSQAGAIVSDSDTSMTFSGRGGLSLPGPLNVLSWQELSFGYWVKQSGTWYYIGVATSNLTGITEYYLYGVPINPNSNVGINLFLGPSFTATGSLTSGNNLDEIEVYNYRLSPAQWAAHNAAAGRSQSQQTGTLFVYIAGNLVVLKNNSFKLSDKVDTRTSCQFVVEDASGLTIYSKGQTVVIVDTIQGGFFTGTVNRPKAINLYPNTNTEWQIDCNDLTWNADKRTSNTIYNTQYAGVIVGDQIQRALSQEGVHGAFALDYNHLKSDWLTGATFDGTVAATNAGDGNVGDGDLELAPAGSAISHNENLSAGTLTNLTYANGALALSSTQGLQLLGTAVQGNTNPYIYYMIWSGSSGISSGDLLQYDVWTASTCPVQSAGVDIGCTDGTTLRDFLPAIVDQNGIAAHPSNDLSGFATDQWYTRTFDLTPLAGKTIAYVSVALEGNSNGSYAAYFRKIKQLASGGGLKQAFFTSTLQTNQIIGLNAYTNISLQQCTVYEMQGTRVSPALSLASLNIPKTSLIDWVAPAPVSSLLPGVPSTNKTLPTVSIQTSIDNGATWQVCTNYGAIPNLQAGMNVSGRSLLIQQLFQMLGTDPTITPTLTGLNLSIQPSYASTKTDVVQTEQLQADWNAGTLSHLNANSNNSLTLNQVSQNWNNGPLSGQTLFGAAGCFQELQNGQCYVAVPAGATNDVRSRLDFAGQWQNFTMDIDIAIGTPVSNTSVGICYRTTGWNNTENSFAWKASYTPGILDLGYGTDGGGNSYTSVVSGGVGLTLSSGASHRMRIQVSGTSHQIFMDGVLVISVSDTHYNQAGYFGLAYFNNASPAAVHGGLFDNFGVCQQLTGTWTSVSQALGVAGVCGNSLIAWQESPDPTMTTQLVVQSSLDGGSTYAFCTNGGTIPGLTPGMSLSGVHLLIQMFFTTTNAEFTPVVTGLTAWVQGQFSSTGTWTSPTLALDNAGRAGSSVCNWNSILANAQTTVQAATSIDLGASFQTVVNAGDPIFGINVQPPLFADVFEDFDVLEYTSGYGVSGSVASWQWDISNSRLLAIGGTSAQLTANVSSSGVGDVDMWFDMDMSDAGGLVWNVSGGNTYYELIVSDASATSVTANQLTFNRYQSGTQTYTQTVSLVFTRNTYHRFHVTSLSGIITVWMDGVQLLQWTDILPLAVGAIGLRNSGNTSRFYQFRYQAQGDLTAGESVITQFTLNSTDPLNTPQVLDMATMVSGPSIGLGALIPGVAYQDTYCSKNIDDLKKQSDYFTYVTNGNEVIFAPRTAYPAPWILQATDPTMSNILVSGLSVEYSGDLYRNRQKLKNVNDSQTFVKQFTGDGKSKTWALDFPVAKGTVPQITVSTSSAIPQSTGIKGQDTGKNYYYTPGGTAIDQDASQGILNGLQTLTVTYVGTFLTDLVLNNTGQFPGTVSQAEYALIDNTSGIIENVFDMSSLDQTKDMDVPTATNYGNQLLQAYGVIGRIVTFMTLKSGLAPGQELSVFIPQHHLANAQTLVTQVDTAAQSAVAQPHQGPLYWYSVVAMEGPAIADAVKLIGSVFG